MLRLALQKVLQGDLSLEAHLGFHAHIHQNTAVLVPLADAVQIAGAALIIDDKRHDLVPEALLEHQQAPDATIAILEGMDALEPNMEIENLMKADILLCLVFFEQLIDGCGDLGGWWSLAELGCGGSLAISGDDGSMALVAAGLAEQGGLQLLDKSLRQRLHGAGEDHIHTEEVIARFDDVVDLDGLFVGEDAVSFVQYLNLIAGEPVAGHATVAVDHVDLQVFIEATVHSAVALFNKGFEEFGKLRSVLLFLCRLLCIFGNLPDAIKLEKAGNAILCAVASDKAFGNTPFFCGFLYGYVAHVYLSFQLI